MREKANRLRIERGQLVAEARRILADETLSVEARTAAFDEAMAKADAIKEEVDQIESLLNSEAELNARQELTAEQNGNTVDEQEATDEFETETFLTYCAGGFMALDEQQRAHAMQRMNPDAEVKKNIQATMSTTTGSEGGYVIPQGFSNKIEVAALRYSGGMTDEGIVTVLRTPTGNPIPWPTTNDTAQEGEMILDNAAVAAADVAFGQAMLNAYLFSSKIVKVPIALMQDSYFDLSALLADLLGQRIGRAWASQLTTGTGTDAPNGIVTASTLGVTAASATAIAYGELVDLEHSVDPDYRDYGRYMFSDAVLKLLRKMVDGDSRPLWSAGMTANAPDTIHNYPYKVNQKMPAPTTGLKSVIFGDLKKYMTRISLAMTLVRLNERFIDNLQIGFLAYARADGELIDAGTNPVKHLIQL